MIFFCPHQKQTTKSNTEHEESDLLTKDSSSPCPASLILKITLCEHRPLKTPST